VQSAPASRTEASVQQGLKSQHPAKSSAWRGVVRSG